MRRPDERGETLVEVVMALAILSLVLVSSYALATGSFRLGRGAGERTQAVNYLQEQAEALRSHRKRSANWGAFAQTVQLYDGSSAGRTFCMKKNSATNIWLLQQATGQACVIDGIAMTITAVADTSSLGANAVPQLYKFNLEGTWKTGGDTNRVNLTTKLVRQD